MNFGPSQPSESAYATPKPGVSAETILAAGLVAGCAARRTKAGKLALLLSLGGFIWRFWKKSEPGSVRHPEPLALPEWTHAHQHVVDAEMLPSQPERSPLIRNFPLSDRRLEQETPLVVEPAPPQARRTIADYLRPQTSELRAEVMAPPTQALHGESPAATVTSIIEPVTSAAGHEEQPADEASFDPFQTFEPTKTTSEKIAVAASPTPVEMVDISWLSPNDAPQSEEFQPLPEPVSALIIEDAPLIDEQKVDATFAPECSLDYSQQVDSPTVAASSTPAQHEPVGIGEEPSDAPSGRLIEATVLITKPEANVVEAEQSRDAPPRNPQNLATVPRLLEPVIERLAAHSPTQPLENWTDVLQGLRRKLGPHVAPPRASATTALSNDPEVTEPAPSLLSSLHLAPATTPIMPALPSEPAYSVDAAAGAAWLLGIEPMPVIHQDAAWPQPLLAGVNTASLRPATTPLSTGGAIPDIVEIPDIAAAVHPAIERAFAKLDASAPMTPFQPVPSPAAVAAPTPPATTKGLLGKIFAAEASAKPKTSPLFASAPPVAQSSPEMAVQQPSWIKAELHATRKPASTQLVAATPQPITSSPRRIVPRAPATLSSDESKRKGMLSWWK